MPAPVGPSSPLRLRSGGRQNWRSWTSSSQSFTLKKTAPGPRDRRFQIGARHAIFQGMDETKIEKLARLSGRVAWKVVGALERRGYDIRGKMSTPISRVPRRVPLPMPGSVAARAAKNAQAMISCVAESRAASSIKSPRGRSIGSVAHCRSWSRFWVTYTPKMLISTCTNRGSTPAPQPERRCFRCSASLRSSSAAL